MKRWNAIEKYKKLKEIKNWIRYDILFALLSWK